MNAQTKTKEEKESERLNAVDHLQIIFGNDCRIYTLIVAATAAGTRRVRCFAVDKEYGTGRPVIFEITYFVARVIGWKINSNDGAIIVTECGTEAGHVIAHALKRKLDMPKLDHTIL